jgi:hypothetical protein
VEPPKEAVVLPSISPKFLDEIPPKIDVQSGESMNYSLPEVFDFNGDEFIIELKDGPDFVSIY